MHTPPAFRDDDLTSLHSAIDAVGLATLVTQTSEGLLGTPMPMLLEPEEGCLGTLYGHLARADPQGSLEAVGNALVNFAGPDAYVSPGWYRSNSEHDRVVPTWNYTAVHAYREGVALGLRGVDTPAARAFAEHTFSAGGGE